MDAPGAQLPKTASPSCRQFHGAKPSEGNRLATPHGCSRHASAVLRSLLSHLLVHQQRLVLSRPEKSHARAEQVATTGEVHDTWLHETCTHGPGSMPQEGCKAIFYMDASVTNEGAPYPPNSDKEEETIHFRGPTMICGHIAHALAFAKAMGWFPSCLMKMAIGWPFES